MSTKDVTINGISYEDVPAVDIPITGTTNKARFVEISDTTAVASDVATGKTFYLADGTKTTGTASTGSVVITDTTDSHGGTIRNISTTDALLLSPTLNITSNGTYTGETSPYKEVWHEINVSVSGGGGSIQANKNATPSTSQVIVTPDSGYDGMAQVTIAGITSGSATTPTRTITANPSITATNGNISATVSGSSSITPTISAGYVTTGTAGTVSVSGSSSVSAASLDSNLVAGNIKNGITIFGVTGIYTGVGLNPWVMRPDAEKIYTLAYDKYIVDDEGVTLPGYTTTSTSLKASETISPTVSRTPADYNYYVAIRALSIPEYSVTTKAKGRVEYSFASAFYEIVDFPANTISALLDNTKITTLSYSIYAAGNNVGLIYWSSGTALARYSSAAYGVAQTITAPTVNGTAITIKTPALITRGHTTYFTSTYMDALTDIRYQYVIEVYRAPKDNLSFNGWGLYNMSDHIMDCVHSSTHKLT